MIERMTAALHEDSADWAGADLLTRSEPGPATCLSLLSLVRASVPQPSWAQGPLSWIWERSWSEEST